MTESKKVRCEECVLRDRCGKFKAMGSCRPDNCGAFLKEKK
jgi:hypothetical protein